MIRSGPLPASICAAIADATATPWSEPPVSTVNTLLTPY
jgi:hypothetical protein